MHPDFSDWYREVELEPDRNTIELRWNGVEALAAESGAEETIGLTRAFYGIWQGDGDLKSRLRAPFLTADPTFPNRDNEAELSLLAGATLVTIMQGKDAYAANCAALLITTASFLELRNGAYSQAIVSIARETLRAKSAGLRNPQVPPSSKMPTLKWDSEALAGTPGLIPAELDRLATYSRALHSQLSGWAKYSEQRLTLMQEELDIAWWLLGEASRQAGCPIASVPAPAAAVFVGAELASMVKALPGPHAAGPMLDRMLGSVANDALDLTSVVLAAAGDNRLECPPLSSEDQLSALLPLTASLALVRKGATKEEWTPWAARVFGIALPLSLSGSSVARQTYLERLTLAALRSTVAGDN